jgi:hypothetical protein
MAVTHAATFGEVPATRDDESESARGAWSVGDACSICAGVSPGQKWRSKLRAGRRRRDAAIARRIVSLTARFCASSGDLRTPPPSFIGTKKPGPHGPGLKFASVGAPANRLPEGKKLPTSDNPSGRIKVNRVASSTTTVCKALPRRTTRRGACQPCALGTIVTKASRTASRFAASNSAFRHDKHYAM